MPGGAAAQGTDRLRDCGDKGQLVRPVEQELVLEETRHYFAYREDKTDDDALGRFRRWFVGQAGVSGTRA